MKKEVRKKNKKIQRYASMGNRAFKFRLAILKSRYKYSFSLLCQHTHKHTVTTSRQNQRSQLCGLYDVWGVETTKTGLNKNEFNSLYDGRKTHWHTHTGCGLHALNSYTKVHWESNRWFTARQPGEHVCPLLTKSYFHSGRVVLLLFTPPHPLVLSHARTDSCT